MTRDAAIAGAESYFASGDFRKDLARRVAMPTESQNPDRAPVLNQYLDSEMTPAFEALGFQCRKLSQSLGPLSVTVRRRY